MWVMSATQTLLGSTTPNWRFSKLGEATAGLRIFRASSISELRAQTFKTHQPRHTMPTIIITHFAQIIMDFCDSHKLTLPLSSHKCLIKPSKRWLSLAFEDCGSVAQV